MPPVIEASHLSKKFKLGAVRDQEDSFRALLLNGLKTSWHAFRRARSNGDDGSASTSMWALRDVNFSIDAGDVVGIIGGNGAGKSTLLKILSRITDPTEGYVRLDGRVASLLEVGTGFHPELTGRENIYMNGVMLGMTKAKFTASSMKSLPSPSSNNSSTRQSSIIRAACMSGSASLSQRISIPRF